MGMVSMCVCGRCLGKSGRKRISLYVFALFLASLRALLVRAICVLYVVECGVGGRGI